MRSISRAPRPDEYTICTAVATTAPLPLRLYLWSSDVAAVQTALIDAGVDCLHTGHPDHAPGGELRTTDPDGNVVVIGQYTPTAGAGPAVARDAGFSILTEAAARFAARGDTGQPCGIGERGGAACPRQAQVKLADPWGTTVWGCLDHAEEALLNARSAFVAVDDGNGLTSWPRRRRDNDPGGGELP